jgi:arabinosaccharide transport system substrate-binding protein
MEFPPGKPLLAIFSAAVLSGAAILCMPHRRPSDLTLWVFADTHAQTYRSLQATFERETGRSLAIDDVGDSINVRLASLFMAGRSGTGLPDAAEIEIGNIGRFFRPPVSDVGFLPLNHYLENSGFRTIRSPFDPGQPGWNARCAADSRIYTYVGSHWQLNPMRTRPDAWIDRIVPARFIPWSKQGVIFGVPHDVHPVSLTYREDLFREAGIDLSASKTWPEFQEQCVAFQKYWHHRGVTYRHALELPGSASDDLVIMLLQRHVNVVDDHDQIHLTEDKVIKTIAFYAQLVAGPQPIGAPAESNTGIWINELERGDICVFWTPDWRVDLLRRYGHPELLRGKLRMMPLPRFDADDAPTSTWGGTMIGIPRGCRDPDESWKLIEFLYLSEAGLDARRKEGDIVSPLMERWNDPVYDQPDPLFGGQQVRKLYVDLAGQIPPRYVNPMTNIAQITLSIVLANAAEYVRNQGTNGLENACRQWLKRAAADVRRRIEHASFEKQDAMP